MRQAEPISQEGLPRANGGELIEGDVRRGRDRGLPRLRGPRPSARPRSRANPSARSLYADARARDLRCFRVYPSLRTTPSVRSLRTTPSR